MLWVLIIYGLLGILSTILFFVKEPFLFYTGWKLILLIPFFILTFPYFLWVIVLFPNHTGRWI